jgi:hypothetical protein
MRAVETVVQIASSVKEKTNKILTKHRAAKAGKCHPCQQPTEKVSLRTWLMRG